MADTLKRNMLGIAVIGASRIGTMRALEKPSGSLHVGYSRFKRRYLLAKEQIVHGDATAVVCLPPPRLYPNA